MGLIFVWSIFLKKLAVFAYRTSYRPFKTILLKIIRPSHSRTASLFSHKYAIHIVLMILMVLVTTQNIQARETGIRDDIGKKSLIYSLIHPEGEEITETFNPSAPRSKNLFDKTGYIYQSAPVLAFDTETDFTATIEESGALVKPSIATTLTSERARESVTYHAVESGETVSTIAENYRISTNTILWENRLSQRGVIQPGDQLTILPTTGVSHQVKRGETLDGIVKKYQGDLDEVIAFNRLIDASAIGEEQILIIPNGVQPAPEPVFRPKPTLASIGSIFDRQDSAAASSVTGGQLNRPTDGLGINQYFSWRHPGIDISKKGGLNVYAAENGRVESVGWTGGYGNTIIINHGSGMKTLYGHLSRFLVKDGESVSRGQHIAVMGSTGWSTGVHLHFEVWINGRKVNPLSYIK